MSDKEMVLNTVENIDDTTSSLTNIQKNGTKVSFNSRVLVGTPKSEFLVEDSQNKYKTKIFKI